MRRPRMAPFSALEGMRHTDWSSLFPGGEALNGFRRYIFSSAVSFSVNVGLTAIFHEIFRAEEELAFAIALTTVTGINFLLHRYYTFAGTGRSLIAQGATFTTSAIGFRGAEYGIFLALHLWLGLLYPVAIVMVLSTSFVGKFFWFRHVIFLRSAHTRDSRPNINSEDKNADNLEPRPRPVPAVP
jgi:putative flippase GtrA